MVTARYRDKVMAGPAPRVAMASVLVVNRRGWNADPRIEDRGQTLLYPSLRKGMDEIALFGTAVPGRGGYGSCEWPYCSTMINVAFWRRRNTGK